MAWVGAGLAAAVTGGIGLLGALFPRVWLGLFSATRGNTGLVLSLLLRATGYPLPGLPVEPPTAFELALTPRPPTALGPSLTAPRGRA